MRSGSTLQQHAESERALGQHHDQRERQVRQHVARVLQPGEVTARGEGRRLSGVTGLSAGAPTPPIQLRLLLMGRCSLYGPVSLVPRLIGQGSREPHMIFRAWALLMVMCYLPLILVCFDLGT